jgi:signal transduction histidine kinase
VKISVQDQGIGISEEDQEHLFSSFFRGANANNIQGTGMGLHIVQRYVDLLGGQIQIQSQLNKGTTVTFTIPVNLA